MEKVEVAVVGGGPAGLAAACVLAEAGVEVLVVERGDYSGSKNVTGGRLYLEPVRAVLPDLWEDAPFERLVVKERLTMMAPGSSLTIELESGRFRGRPPHSATVLRATFDQWLAEKAGEKGAVVVPGYQVDDLLMEGGRVTGIRSADAEVQADVVVAADGVLSFVAEKAGLRPRHDPRHLALGVKEVIELPEEKIQDRFGLQPDEGAAQLFFGSITAGMFGGGFLYTNRRSLSLGLVIGTHALMEHQPPVPPHDLMEAFRARPEVAALIAGGQPVEYSAHSIPEGGPAAMPRLVTDGMVVVGDAAGLALNQAVTVRGMDMALVSGVLAARAILAAREANDFSAAGLASYEETLKASSVYQDLATFQHVPEVLSNPRLFEEYPQVACELFEQIMWTGAEPKEKMSRTALRTVRRLMRPRYLGDLWKMRKI
ncbi:MAG TPA: FAD-dependent monooxygenase [Acidimicrobiia bacterium]|nr:FAD-dependent monooxygenase [Acidimicrobiia bacterium]